MPYPLEKGDKLRAFHQIRELSVTHDIILCALSDVPVTDEARAFLQPYVARLITFRLSKPGIFWHLAVNFFSHRPFQVAYFYRPRIQRQIEQIIRDHHPDYFYAQLIRTAEYLKSLHIRKTLDYQDVFSRGLYRRWQVAPWYKKAMLGMEYRRVLKYEEMIFDKFDKKTIISYPDRDFIPHLRRDRIEVIPNGVDFEYFQPSAAAKEFDIIFSGNMAYPPNINGAIYLVKRVMPHVWKKIPSAKVVIAGANPSQAVKHLQSDKVIVTGWVDDMREYYDKSCIFVAPMQIGTGLQNKVLEAMAMKLPCITSPLANDALNATEDKEVLVGHDPDSFAQHVVSLLSDPQRSQQLANNGYQFVRSNYQWSVICKRLLQVITS